MSKWTGYQLAILTVFILFIIFKNTYTDMVDQLFSFVEQWIPSSVMVVFFTVILVVWGTACVLILQSKKGQPMFDHKLWRIMPAIMGVVIVASFGFVLYFFLTAISSITPTLFWLLDSSIIYFIVILYLFVLSLFIRYGKKDKAENKIITSAHTTVLVVFIVLWVLPGIV